MSAPDKPVPEPKNPTPSPELDKSIKPAVTIENDNMKDFTRAFEKYRKSPNNKNEVRAAEPESTIEDKAEFDKAFKDYKARGSTNV